MKLNKVVWSVDLAREGMSPSKKVGALVKKGLVANGVTVIPTYVLNFSELNFVKDITPKERKKYLDTYQKRMDKLLKDTGLSELKSSIITSTNRGIASDVKALERFAKSMRANAIMAASRNRNILSRCFLGSFADTLMFTSKVPLLLVKPTTKMPTKFKNVFYSTQLDKKVNRDVKGLIELAKSLGSKIHIFHYFGLGRGTARQPDFIRKKLEKINDKLSDLKKLCKKSKIDCKTSIKHEEMSVTKAILEASTSPKADLIVVRGKVDMVGSFLVGSTTRSIVRHSEAPVLIIH